MNQRLMIPVVLSVITTVLGETGGKDNVIVCFFTNWAQYRKDIGKFHTDDIDATLCTHLVYAFHKINTQFNTLQPVEWNYASVLHPGILKARQLNPELKLILSVGGATASESAWVSISRPEVAGAFSRNVVTYLRQNGFDGLDVDWEVPTALTARSYDRLIQSLRSAIDRETVPDGLRKLLLITDVSPNPNSITFYSPPKLAAAMDFISVMAYDFYGKWSTRVGHHSPLFLSHAELPGSFNSQHQAVERWLQAGVPVSKLVLGVAAYGRSLLLSSLDQHTPGSGFTRRYPFGGPFTRSPGSYAFYEICRMRGEAGMQKVFINESRVPYLYGISQGQPIWVGYDDVNSVSEKSMYAVSRGLAGVMMWSLDFDDFRGTECSQSHTYPLLRAIRDVLTLTRRCSRHSDCDTDRAVCVSGFCGCPAGTFLATKSFCTDITPPQVTTTASSGASKIHLGPNLLTLIVFSSYIITLVYSFRIALRDTIL